MLMRDGFLKIDMHTMVLNVYRSCPMLDSQIGPDIWKCHGNIQHLQQSAGIGVYLLQSCVLLFVNVSMGSISHLVLHFFGKHLRNSCPSIATSPGLCPWNYSPTLCYATLHTSGLRETTHATQTSGHSQTCGTLRSKCRPAASTGPLNLHEPLQWKRTPILLRPIATVRSCFLPIPQPRYYTDSVGTAPCLHIRSHPRKATTATFRPRHLRIPLPESLSCPGVVQPTAVKPRWMHPQPYPQDSWHWLKAFRPRDLASPSPITTTSCHTKPTYDLDTDFDTVPAQSILKAPGHDDTLVLPLQYPACRIRFHQDTRFGTVDPWLCRRAQTPNGHLAIVTSCQSWPAVTRAATSAVSSPDTPQFPLTLSLLHVARLRICCTTKINDVPFGFLGWYLALDLPNCHRIRPALQPSHVWYGWLGLIRGFAR